MKIIKTDGFFTTGKVEDRRINWLIDTGCTVTIISTKVFEKIHPDERPELQPYEKNLLSADDSLIKVQGQTKFNIQLGEKLIQHPCLVANISNEGLLGMDFLQTHHMVIDFSTNKITCEGEVLIARCREGQNHACRVMVAEHVTIPPESRTIIQAQTKKPLASGTWLIEPLSHTPGHKPVIVGKTLVSTCGTKMPVELMNPTDEEVTLYKYTNLGITSRIPDVDIVCEISPTKIPISDDHESRNDDNLPPEVQKIIDEIEIPMDEDQKRRIEALLKKNLEVFATDEKPFGHTDLVKHEIITDQQIPIKQPVRRIPFHLKEAAEKEVQRMLDKDVIEPSNSPWASPVVLVRKKDGSLRYCIDYRRLNAITKKDSYPLPRIDDSLDHLGQAKYFSTLDLASGYWQIGLSEDAKEKSAFCTPQGLFQFRVMPFGLTNAPATFQRLMERILAGLQWQICLIYIDDIIIFSRTLDDHISQIQTIFQRLRDAGLKLKPKKCFLFRPKVKYLGHVVSNEGIETDPDKISAVKDWPVPDNLTDVRSFVGLCSYYRRFIPDFATIAKPLLVLTEKNSPFKWGSEQENSWLQLKEKLVSSPILAYPDRDATFVLDTDASNYGIGAVLSQTIDGQEKVIAYGSRILTKPERRYCITRKELLAVVHFVRTYRHYLIGRPFIVRTDHAALRWLRSFKEPEGQIARWLETLDSYNFTLVHRPGKKHSNADALSRGPCAQCGGDHEGQTIRVGRRKKDDSACPVKTRAQLKTDDGIPTSNWLSSIVLNTDLIRTKQQADPLLSEVFCWVKDGIRPNFGDISHEGTELKFYWGQFRSLKVIDGLLIRELDRPNLPMKRQILMPPDLRSEALNECHSVLTAGHLGQKKTLANVKRRFLWPGMTNDTEAYVRSCDICAKYKTDGQKRRGGLKDFRVGIPMERVCVDIVGPFPKSVNGNKYGLVITDCFTKFVEIYPLPNQEASTVARVLTREFFSRYGVPRFLHSDQGTQFESSLFSDICQLLGIEKTRTTPFRPQSDGQSERNIKTLTRMIAMSADEQENWDEFLPFLAMAYRATPHVSVGISPNYMMFGRELSVPVDVMLPPCADDSVSPHEYVAKLKSKLTYAYGLARKNLKKNAERQINLYNRRKHGETFAAGDLVWYANKLRKKGLSPKLQPKWRGPCLVLKMYNDVLAEVKLSVKKSVVVHTDLLKPCHSVNLPAWLKKARKSLKTIPT